MRELYFETENAILRFFHDDVVERLPYFQSTIGMAEATTLRDFLPRSDHSISVPKEQYHFAYVALDPTEQGKGVVYCEAGKRDYETKELKRAVLLTRAYFTQCIARQ